MPEQKEKDFLRYYVKPHHKKSRVVTDADMDKVVKAAHILYNLCHTQRGTYHGLAVAHSQIAAKDPMNFFVTADKQVIINPVITNHLNYTVDSEEGCLSYPDRPMITVQRWRKIEVEYQELKVQRREGEEGISFILSEVMAKKLSLKEAFIFQHEVDHANGKFIYDN